MKYSAPFIDIVCFSSSDSPRVGMQWWFFNSERHWAVAPMNWTPSEHQPDGVVENADSGLETLCDKVQKFALTSDGSLPNAFVLNSKYSIADDGQSC